MSEANPTARINVGPFAAIIDQTDFSVVSHLTWYACNGYARADIWSKGKRRRVYMHRLILQTELEVDHINGDKLDNRRCNLRSATRTQNLQNRRGATKQSRTGLRGVYVDKRDGAIYARCIVNGKSLNLGRFNTLEEAAATVSRARSENMTHSVEGPR